VPVHENGELFEVWEIYATVTLNKKLGPQRIVFTVIPGSPDDILRKPRPLPYKHGQWPFVDYRYEYNRPEIGNTRGIASKAGDIAKIITDVHRAKLNLTNMILSPTMLYRENSHIDPDTWKYIPGTFYPIREPGDLSVFQIPDMTPVAQATENTLRGILQDYVGVPDYALSGPNSAVGDPRTAREVGAIQGIVSRSEGIRMHGFVKAIGRIYRMIWALVREWEEPGVWIKVTGEEMPLRTTRDVLEHDYDIVPNVPKGSFDPSFQAQLDLARIQTLSQMMPMLQQSPEYVVNFGLATADWLERSDFRAARRYVRRRSHEEMQALSQNFQQQRDLQMRAAEADIAAKNGAASGGQARAMAAVSQARQQEAQAAQQQPQQQGGMM
jgi:hypothetical protein